MKPDSVEDSRKSFHFDNLKYKNLQKLPSNITSHRNANCVYISFDRQK